MPKTSGNTSTSRPAAKERLRALLSYVLELYPDRRIELDYETPFQLFLAVQLSAQTTDKQVNRVTSKFFGRVREASDVAAMPLPEFTALVSSVNYFRNKARNIHASARIIAGELGGKIPDTLEAIMELPGVGVKTAKVLLHQLYGHPMVGVDTHIHRVLNRVGAVKTATPEETDRAVERLFTREQKDSAHHALVLFGRYRCKAAKPLCQECALRGTCAFYRLRKP